LTQEQGAKITGQKQADISRIVNSRDQRTKSVGCNRYNEKPRVFPFK
jgi:hypothetical protein